MRIKHILLLFITSSFILVSCSKSRHEEFGRKLSKAFKSKKYKNFSTSDYDEVFKEELVKLKPELHDPKWIDKIYQQDDNGLILLDQFLVSGEIDNLHQSLLNAKFHGLNASYFHADKITELLDSVKTTKFKDVSESYPLLAKLE